MVLGMENSDAFVFIGLQYTFTSNTSMEKLFLTLDALHCSTKETANVHHYCLFLHVLCSEETDFNRTLMFQPSQFSIAM